MTVGGDETYAQVLQSALTRELRKLDSVEVVDERDARYELGVVTVRTSRLYAAAVLLTSKADVTIALYFSDDEACYPTEGQIKSTEEFYSDYAFVSNHWVFTDADLQSLATRVASAVDVSDIELHRQTSRRLEELRKKHRPKPPS